MSRRICFAILIVVVHVIAPLVCAQPGPVLNPPPPIALQQGQTIEVVLSGANLGTITSSPIADARGLSASLVKPEKPNPGELHLKISATADAALGDREMRLVGSAGVTAPINLFVSQFPVTAEKEPNNSPAEAPEIQLPATLLGRIDSPGDIDLFRFTAVKGQQLIFDVRAGRLGSKLDPVVTIHSAAGREMRTVTEHREGDPILIFKVPEDGQYLLRIRDLQYRGAADFDYRVVAGRIPYLEAILPAAASLEA